jgi:hypothetical protein
MDPAFDGYRLDGRLDVPGSPTAARRSSAPDRLRWVSPLDPPPAPAPREPAQLWRGTRLSDGLRVAIKVVPLAAAAALRREAALLSAVEHPHVLALLDVVAGKEHVGLVTAWAAGGSLAALLARRGRLTWQESLTVMIPLADALAAADERGMVHGDLSCGNVLFDLAGRPLLADLGAARAAAELSAPVAVTPTDVAPEVARGATPDHRSDLFSLGSIALQCLSGRAAWPAHTVADVLAQSTAGQWPDPDDVIAPEELLAVVRRLLDPEPGRRGLAASAAVDLRAVGDAAPVDLDARGADGSPRLPATQVRPDVAALRRAALAGSRRRAGRHAAGRPRSREGSCGAEATRSHPSSAGADRRGVGPHGFRLRTAAVAVVVIGLLGFTAVRVGLWWAGWGRTDPVSAPAVPPGATGPISTAASPAGVPPAGAPGAGAPAAGVPPTVGPGPVDWTAEVARLDAARARALVERDPGLLDLVYTRGSPARTGDAATIGRLVAAGYRLADARHTIGGVTLLSPRASPGAGEVATVSLRVLESLPPAEIVDPLGRPLGHTVGTPVAAVVLTLARTPDGLRIDAISPG